MPTNSPPGATRASKVSSPNRSASSAALFTLPAEPVAFHSSQAVARECRVHLAPRGAARLHPARVSASKAKISRDRRRGSVGGARPAGSELMSAAAAAAEVLGWPSRRPLRFRGRLQTNRRSVFSRTQFFFFTLQRKWPPNCENHYPIAPPQSPLPARARS
jgi:hypothetical protein